MKKQINYFTVTLLLLIIIAIPVLADAPPDPGGDPNTGGGTPVGGTPIGGGLFVMAVYGIIYGIAKFRIFIRK